VTYRILLNPVVCWWQSTGFALECPICVPWVRACVMMAGEDSMQQTAYVEVTRPLWHRGTQAALVSFGLGALLGGALPLGAALASVPALWLAVAWGVDQLQGREDPTL
jgi:hypothetical protein